MNSGLLFLTLNPIALRKAKIAYIFTFLSAIGLKHQTKIAADDILINFDFYLLKKNKA